MWILQGGVMRHWCKLCNVLSFSWCCSLHLELLQENMFTYLWHTGSVLNLDMSGRRRVPEVQTFLKWVQAMNYLFYYYLITELMRCRGKMKTCVCVVESARDAGKNYIWAKISPWHITGKNICIEMFLILRAKCDGSQFPKDVKPSHLLKIWKIV